MSHICFSAAKNCQNFYDSYGQICVGCNCCGRIDPQTMLQCQLGLNRRMLKEAQEFNGWSTDPEFNALQHKNVAINIKWFKRKIKAIETKMAQEVPHA